MNAATNEHVTTQIISFLRHIGLEVRAGWIEGNSVLPGIIVEHGVLIYDAARLQHPGDLLHEAGHLAVKTAADRKLCGADLGADPAEEMMAIGWSYAAILHLGLPPEIVFHAAGYCNGSDSLLENFRAGRYIGVPMLQWLGLTYDEKRAQEAGAEPYPKMKLWLRQT